MPIAADIVVANAAAVSKTFSLLVPSSGDGSIATHALKEGLSPVVWPTLTTSTRRTQNGSRKGAIKLVVPDSYTDTTTGLGKVNSRMEFNCDVTVPTDFPASKRADAAAYFANIMATAVMKAFTADALPLV